MRALPTSSQINTSWRKVLHDEDMAAAILDRVLERGRFIHLDGPPGEPVISTWKRPCQKTQNGSEFPEPNPHQSNIAPSLCYEHRPARHYTANWSCGQRLRRIIRGG